MSAMRVGSCAISASCSSASRSRSAFSTTLIRLSGPSGASWARLPTRQRGGMPMLAGFDRQFAADRGKQRRFADAVAADKADARAGHDLHRAVIDQSRPAIRTDMSVIESMRGCHRTRRQTQPR